MAYSSPMEPKRKRGYAVVTLGGRVYKDRHGRLEFSYWRCLARTLVPWSECYGGTVHHLPFRGYGSGKGIPRFGADEAWS